MRTPENASLWFSSLPPEILVRILSFLPPCPRQHTAFTLLSLSPSTQPTLTTALHNTLTLTSTTPALHFHTSTRLFPRSLTRLTAVHPEFAVTQLTPTLVSLTRLISLNTRIHTLTVPSCLIRHISHLNHLRKLTVYQIEPRTIDIGDVIYNTLVCLNLSSLTLRCAHTEPPSPGYASKSCDTIIRLSSRIQTAPICQNLAHIDLNCLKRLSHTSLLRIITSFPRLTHATIHSPIPHTYLPFLRTLACVDIDTTESVNTPDRFATIPNAHALGLNVRAIITQLELSHAQILSLAACVKLQVLETRLERGAEEALLHVAHNLHTLRLCWFGDWIHANHAYKVHWHAPRPLLMPLIMRRKKSLTCLSLTNVALPAADLARILETNGPLLTAFGTTVCLQDDRVLQRLATVLRLVGRFCARLETLLVKDSLEKHYVPEKGSCQERAQVQVCVAYVKRCLPKLDLDSVEACLSLYSPASSSSAK